MIQAGSQSPPPQWGDFVDIVLQDAVLYTPMCLAVGLSGQRRKEARSCVGEECQRRVC